MKIAITGSTGLVGSALADALRADGHAITRVVRQRERARKAGVAYWNPDRGEVDEASLEGHDAIIHLAGESLFGLWTRRRKEAIRRSRVQGTQLLASALAGLERPPSVLLTASAIGYYGDHPPEEVLDETTPGAGGFLPGVVRAWEAATEPADVAGIRTVQLRFGLVLARGGGIVGTMLPAFRAGLGAIVGPGDQAWSWVALPEIPRIVAHVLASPSIAGPVNVTAPGAVSAAQFSRTLGRVLRRPVLLKIPGFVVTRLPGGMGRELAAASARVIPRKLEESGYRFAFPELESALREILDRPRPAAKDAGSAARP